MSEHESVEEAFEGHLRVAVAGAGRMAEHVARLRQSDAEDRTQSMERDAGELQRRFDGERAAASTAWAGVDDPQWWDTARREDIAEAYRVSAGWRAADVDAARAEQEIVNQVQRRYGIDVRALAPAEVADQLARGERAASARDVAEANQLSNAADRFDHRSRDRVREDGLDQDEVDAVTAGADDRLAEPAAVDDLEDLGRRRVDALEAAELDAQAAAGYDSAERRAATAARLESRVDDVEAVNAVMLSDLSQGRPARDAVKQRPSRSKTAAGRRQPAPLARQQQAERTR